MSLIAFATRRYANAAGFLACAGMMAFALYAQYGMLLEPCPLCTLQRIATIVLGLVFLLAFLHNPSGWGARIYAALIFLAAAAGTAVAGRHVWIQSLPADQVPACGAPLEFLMETMPLLDVLLEVLTGSGECAEVSWSFLGLSMPSWVVICLAALGIAGLVANLRLPARR